MMSSESFVVSSPVVDIPVDQPNPLQLVLKKVHRTFGENLSFGQIGEKIWENILLSNGYLVLPVYEGVSGGKGPRLLVPGSQKYIAPDMMSFGNDELPTWVEVKRKTSCTWHIIGGKWCIGIDSVYFDDYVKIHEITRDQVRMWILVMIDGGYSKDSEGQPSPSGFYGAPIDFLIKYFSHESEDMKYFPLAAFNHYATLEEWGNGDFKFQFQYEDTESDFMKKIRMIRKKSQG